jgi:hypothetical protein
VPTAVRVEPRWSAEREDGTAAHPADAVRTAVEAAFLEEVLAGLDAQNLAAAYAPVVTGADVARRACPVSSDAAANTVDEAAALHHQVGPAKMAVRQPALPAWRRQLEAPAVARCAAA